MWWTLWRCTGKDSFNVHSFCFTNDVLDEFLVPSFCYSSSCMDEPVNAIYIIYWKAPRNHTTVRIYNLKLYWLIFIVVDLLRFACFQPLGSILYSLRSNTLGHSRFLYSPHAGIYYISISHLFHTVFFRKFFTVLCSVFVFGNVLTIEQWVGALVVFTGLAFDLYFNF